MTDDTQSDREIEYRLHQATKDLATAKKVATLATTANNPGALTPANFAVELAEDAIACFEAIRVEADIARVSAMLDDTIILQDRCGEHIDQALAALTGGNEKAGAVWLHPGFVSPRGLQRGSACDDYYIVAKTLQPTSR